MFISVPCIYKNNVLHQSNDLYVTKTTGVIINPYLIDLDDMFY